MSIIKFAGALLVTAVVARPFNDYAPYAPYEPYMPYTPYNNYQAYNYQNSEPYIENRNKPINIANNNNNVNNNGDQESSEHGSQHGFHGGSLHGAADAIVPQRGSPGILGMVPSILG